MIGAEEAAMTIHAVKPLRNKTTDLRIAVSAGMIFAFQGEAGGGKAIVKNVTHG